MSLMFSMVPPQKSEVSNLLLPSLQELLAVCKRYQKFKQERLKTRRNSAELQEKDEKSQSKLAAEGDQGPVKKRRRTDSPDAREQLKMEDCDASEKPGPSGESSCGTRPEETQEASPPRQQSTHILLGPRTPPDWVDTLAKTIQSAISKVPQ